MVGFSQEFVERFKKEWNSYSPTHKKVVRVGQAFHLFMNLNKVTSQNNREWADLLWNKDGREAWEMIEEKVF